MKTIVTHISPDQDACTSTWLVKRFMPGWENAEIAFTGAGTTLNGMDPDSDPDIIHVDTGLGKFDHHQTNANTCASKLVFEYLVNEGDIEQKNIPALEKLVNFVNLIDHFGEVDFPDPANDRYDFMLPMFLDNFKNTLKDDQKTMEIVFTCLDAILSVYKGKVKAEEDIKNGYIFQSRWGKTLAVESPYEGTIKLALKQGFDLVVRKDVEKGYVRIKCQPKDELDLTPLYEKLKQADPKAFWFLHISKHMLLNGSSKNPNMTPSSLSIQKVIEIIRKI